VRVSAIGDVLLTTPLLRASRTKWPGARVTFLTKRQHVPLVSDNPNVTEVFGVTPQDTARTLAARIRTVRYTHLLDLQGGLRTFPLRLLARGPWSGYSHRSAPRLSSPATPASCTWPPASGRRSWRCSGRRCGNSDSSPTTPTRASSSASWTAGRAAATAAPNVRSSTTSACARFSPTWYSRRSPGRSHDGRSHERVGSGGHRVARRAAADRARAAAGRDL